jgi:hypothetical protein
VVWCGVVRCDDVWRGVVCEFQSEKIGYIWKLDLRRLMKGNL